jgi:GDP-mannose 6-dehydrogenase
MKIAVFGLGYVGSVSAACLANAGHHVVGVDLNRTKVGLVNRGESPVVEKRLGLLLKEAVAQDRLHATVEAKVAVAGSDMAWICVGTPSLSRGGLDLSQLERVGAAIGRALADQKGRYMVVLRSTVLPGTTQNALGPLIEAGSGKPAGVGFDLCYHPEFLREGNAVEDFEDPPKIVVGAGDERSREALLALYAGSGAPVFRMSIEEAELLKYVDNSWHALKVTFANEIGRIAREAGTSGARLMAALCQDRRLNISPSYLRPGFAFGGSCLPKDLRILTHFARASGIDVPVLEAVLPSNLRTLEEGVRLVVDCRRRRVGLSGLSFKAGTDDLRESPLVELAERLLGKGFDLRIFDATVNLARLIGANRRFIKDRIPHLESLMVEDQDALVAHADVVVLGHAAAADLDIGAILRQQKLVVDLCGVGQEFAGQAGYQGISW